MVTCPIMISLNNWWTGNWFYFNLYWFRLRLANWWKPHSNRILNKFECIFLATYFIRPKYFERDLFWELIWQSHDMKSWITELSISTRSKFGTSTNCCKKILILSWLILTEHFLNNWTASLKQSCPFIQPLVYKLTKFYQNYEPLKRKLQNCVEFRPKRIRWSWSVGAGSKIHFASTWLRRSIRINHNLFALEDLPHSR